MYYQCMYFSIEGVDDVRCYISLIVNQCKALNVRALFHFTMQRRVLLIEEQPIAGLLDTQKP
jgi:hypothetical protein